MKQLREAIIETLDQIQCLIQYVPSEDYIQSTEHNTSSIGRHIRHILDHFLAIQTGINNGCIDYNQRNRDSFVETSPQAATTLIQEIDSWIKNQDLNDCTIEVMSEISVIQKQNITIPSYIHREYIYVINHAYHHLAYASLMAKNLGIKIPKQIGIAPSTASYLRLIESTR